jgi:peptidoglycan hydrolase-like protein with peptidoglycan-binding domain
MSARTRKAIRDFQRREGLRTSGIVGPATQRALNAALTQTDSGRDEFEGEMEISRSSRDYIRWVQNALNRILGFRLSVDGIMGKYTRSAVRRFQQRAGLAADGIVGPMTESALISAGASPPPRTDSVPSPGASAATPDIVSVRGIRVARSIAPRVSALLDAASSAGVELGGWGYRSSARQIELRRRHCGTTHYDIYDKPSSQCHPPTARPGRSMHERGLAIDFTYRGGSISDHRNPGYQWLAANAGRFGLFNLPSEPWHWSTTGN